MLISFTCQPERRQSHLILERLTYTSWILALLTEYSSSIGPFVFLCRFAGVLETILHPLS